MGDMLTCSKCLAVKPDSDFYICKKNRSRRFRHSFCTDCKSRYGRQQYVKLCARIPRRRSIQIFVVGASQ